MAIMTHVSRAMIGSSRLACWLSEPGLIVRAGATSPAELIRELFNQKQGTWEPGSEGTRKISHARLFLVP